MPSITISAFIRVRLFVILLLLGLACCRPKTEKPPADLLGKEEMVSALIRIHLLESDLELKNLPTDTANAIIQREEKKILDSQKIDEQRFRSSYEFYLKHPQYLDVIYATVIDSLSLREAIVTQREITGDTTAALPAQAPAKTPL